MKNNLIIISIIISLISNQNFADNGGAIAAGVLGGLGVGAIIGSAASNKRSRDVVYVNDSRPYYNSTSMQTGRLDRWEQDLNDREVDLNAWEQDLKRREKKLRRSSFGQSQYL